MDINELTKAYGEACHGYSLAKARLIDFMREWDEREHESSDDGLFYSQPTQIAKNLRAAGERHLDEEAERAWHARQRAFNELMDAVGGERDAAEFESTLYKLKNLRRSDVDVELPERAQIACLWPGDAHRNMLRWLLHSYETRYRIPGYIFETALKGSGE